MRISSKAARTFFAALAAAVGLGIGVAALVAHAVGAQPSAHGDAGFMPENARAMQKMMAAMAIAPSGVVDRDFVAMMTPHHQGAIEMALAELRYGKDETLRRMAQEIIVEQQQEIVAMRQAAARLPARSSAAPAGQDICTSRPQ